MGNVILRLIARFTQDDHTATIRRLVAEGFCPVECSLGQKSVVDGLEMDHHGTCAHLEAVELLLLWHAVRGPDRDDAGVAIFIQEMEKSL
ncbi:MAG: hypothetical protein HQL82_13230 [Magnetococcales bacterium]|nr:hypothetical protein [Magnetococcales bacterium]